MPDVSNISLKLLHNAVVLLRLGFRKFLRLVEQFIRTDQLQGIKSNWHSIAYNCF